MRVRAFDFLLAFNEGVKDVVFFLGCAEEIAALCQGEGREASDGIEILDLNAEDLFYVFQFELNLENVSKLTDNKEKEAFPSISRKCRKLSLPIPRPTSSPREPDNLLNRLIITLLSPIISIQQKILQQHNDSSRSLIAAGHRDEHMRSGINLHLLLPYHTVHAEIHLIVDDTLADATHIY